jgi:protein-tyrosine phosphatase
MDFAQVLPALFVGSHPSTIDDVERLQYDLAVTAIMNLQTDEDMASVGLLWQPIEEHYKTTALRLVRLPVKEDQVEMAEKFSNCVSTLRDLLSPENQTVYLHCTAGIARSPTVAIGHLHWNLGWEWEEAIAHLKQVRENCSPHLEALRLAMATRQPAPARSRLGFHISTKK